MYAGRHDQALTDYTHAIELNPNYAGHWRRRAHAFTIAPTPQPERGIEDATRAIELGPEHPMATPTAPSPTHNCRRRNGATPSPTWTDTSNCWKATTPRRTDCERTPETLGAKREPSGITRCRQPVNLPGKFQPNRK